MSTLKDLRKDCLELEQQIERLLMNFQDKHGVAICNVGLIPYYITGISLPKLAVELEVKLN